MACTLYLNTRLEELLKASIGDYRATTRAIKDEVALVLATRYPCLVERRFRPRATAPTNDCYDDDLALLRHATWSLPVPAADDVAVGASVVDAFVAAYRTARTAVTDIAQRLDTEFARPGGVYERSYIGNMRPLTGDERVAVLTAAGFGAQCVADARAALPPLAVDTILQPLLTGVPSLIASVAARAVHDILAMRLEMQCERLHKWARPADPPGRSDFFAPRPSVFSESTLHGFTTNRLYVRADEVRAAVEGSAELAAHARAQHAYHDALRWLAAQLVERLARRHRDLEARVHAHMEKQRPRKRRELVDADPRFAEEDAHFCAVAACFA